MATQMVCENTCIMYGYVPLQGIMRVCCWPCRRCLEKRTRVEVVTDPCHPCFHNPVRPAILPPDTHYRLTARTNLKAGGLLGLYWGEVVTMR